MVYKEKSGVKTCNLIKKLAKRWSTGTPGSSRFCIERIEQRKKCGTLMAVITTRGARTGFYNPIASVMKMLEDAGDPLKQPQPVRHLDRDVVKSTAIEDAGRARWAHKSTQSDRMRRIAGPFIKMWEGGPVPSQGAFFLYSNRVLFQAFDPVKGWTNLRVPEEGIDWSILK
jgi:hypothetical protein